MNQVSEKRRYIRHPASVPIEIGEDDDHSLQEKSLRNVSQGGICFHSAVPFTQGSMIRVKISVIQPVFVSKGRVAWCRESGGGFDVGIEFIDAGDAFRARMVEQVCHIEQYRSDVLSREGRVLSGREAALEWIEKYAETF